MKIYTKQMDKIKFGTFDLPSLSNSFLCISIITGDAKVFSFIKAYS